LLVEVEVVVKMAVKEVAALVDIVSFLHNL
jgi:hypothetical protein